MSTTPHPTLLASLPAEGLMTSRKETALRYLRTLEAEYLTCQLRGLIYTRPNDRAYYQRVLEQKQERIERIGVRESIQTLFQDPAVRTQHEDRLFGQGGLPTFHYKDYSDEQKFKESDRRNYYQPGRTVRLADGGRGRCAGLTDDGRVRVRLEGQSRKTPTKVFTTAQVTRIFTAPVLDACPSTTTAALAAAE